MAVQVQKVWSNCLDRISSLVPKYSYNTWIRPLRAISLDEKNGHILNLEVPNLFHQKWIEENYYDIVGKTIREVLGPKAAMHLSLPVASTSVMDYTAASSVAYTVTPAVKSPPAPEKKQTRSVTHTQHTQPVLKQRPQTRKPAPQPNNYGGHPRKPAPRLNNNAVEQTKVPHVGLQLNKNYTFDELIEGDCNRLAYNAAKAIAQTPGSTSFNPLFVYGAAGLGKTHLAQSICHYATKHGTARNPMYVSIDDFTNQFIASIRANKCHDFTTFYRQADLLVVDDIQFLTGKERTQEEFFHLFNTIHHAGGQIVLCADRPPNEIAGIHNRLISRFQWGLTTDIKAPDVSTRIAILLKKANRFKIDLSHEIAEKIASSVHKNVRELESVLTKMLAYSSLHKTPISFQLASQVLHQYGSHTSFHLTIDEIITIVSETFGTQPEYIVGKSRKREIVLARHAAMHLAKEFTQHSLKSIGLHFAGRDHSTVIHAIKAVEARIDTEPLFASKLEHAKQAVQDRAKNSLAS